MNLGGFVYGERRTKTQAGFATFGLPWETGVRLVVSREPEVGAPYRFAVSLYGWTFETEATAHARFVERDTLVRRVRRAAWLANAALRGGTTTIEVNDLNGAQRFVGVPTK